MASNFVVAGIDLDTRYNWDDNLPYQIKQVNEGGSWISQRDSTDVAVRIKQEVTEDWTSYVAWAKAKQTTYTFTMGSLTSPTYSWVGFFTYLNSRTANGFDYGAFMRNDKTFVVAGTGGTIATEYIVNPTAKSYITDNSEAMTQAFQNLTPKSFYNTHTKRNDYGFIAEDVHNVLPAATNDDATGVDYRKLTTVLIAQLQANRKRIEDLKNK